MKKMTIRVDDYIYDRVNLLAKESKISANKIVANILKDNLLKNNDIDYSKENARLDAILKDDKAYLDKLDKEKTIKSKKSVYKELFYCYNI